LNTFQFLCFGQPLKPDELASILHCCCCRLCCAVANPFDAASCRIVFCALHPSTPTQDGALNDDELNTFQFLCFGQPLTPDELASVRQMVAERMADGLNDAGLLFPGFMYLHTLFLTRGRLESTWTVLRLFGK
jgi:hypothetical protein